MLYIYVGWVGRNSYCTCQMRSTWVNHESMTNADSRRSALRLGTRVLCISRMCYTVGIYDDSSAKTQV